MNRHNLSLRKTAVFALAFLLLFCWQGCNTPVKVGEAREVPDIPVSVQVVHESAVVVPVKVTGHLTARSQVKLSFKTGGIIAGIMVQEGSKVIAGQELARLDMAEINARERQATLSYNKSLRDYRRVLNLYRDSVATLEQLENVRTARDVAMNNLRIARFNLDHSVIYAPSDGKILKQLAEKGEVIGAGHPVFLFASTAEAWVIRCAVADKDIVRLHLQDSSTVTFDVWPAALFSGRVTEIAQAADPYSGTYETEVTLDTARLKLVSGLLANVTLIPSDTIDAMLIPVRALSGADLLQGTIYRVRNGRARSRRVTVDRVLDSMMLIRHGLVPGDSVIVEGVEKLDEGVGVQVINKDKPE